MTAGAINPVAVLLETSNKLSLFLPTNWTLGIGTLKIHLWAPAEIVQKCGSRNLDVSKYRANGKGEEFHKNQ